jgi:hypothetical protein
MSYFGLLTHVQCGLLSSDPGCFLSSMICIHPISPIVMKRQSIVSTAPARGAEFLGAMVANTSRKKILWRGRFRQRILTLRKCNMPWYCAWYVILTFMNVHLHSKGNLHLTEKMHAELLNKFQSSEWLKLCMNSFCKLTTTMFHEALQNYSHEILQQHQWVSPVRF